MSNVSTRVSCPGFAIINDGTRYGLMTDMDFGSGLMPIGGALHGTAHGITRIMTQFKVKAAAFDPGSAGALRFTAPTESVKAIANWFGSRIERDKSLRRVLHNSLFEETAILTRSEVKQAREEFVGFSQMRDVSFRTDVWERDTLYLIECQKVLFPPAIMAKLVHQSAAARSHFRFVTAAEINAGEATIGQVKVPINPIARTLLNPKMPNRKQT
jgi:hypothetical protein